jgi:hypothetical protein
MPAAADIGHLLRLLGDESDLVVSLHAGEEAVDVDLAKMTRRRDMLLWRQRLIAKDDDAVLGERLTNVRYKRIRECGKIDPGELDADGARHRPRGQGIAYRHLAPHRFF